MHWVAAQPGCLDSERELILIDQTPGEIVFLSAADTDLASAARAWSSRFGPRLRIAHAGALRQPVSADNYIETVIKHARLVVVRLLGGRAYFPHFLQGLIDLKDQPNRPDLLLLSGTDSFDEDLAQLSDFPRSTCEQVFRYFQEGGRENTNRAGEAFDRLLAREIHALPPAVPMPVCGIYRRSTQRHAHHALLTFYRAWFQAEDLAVVDHLIDTLEQKGIFGHRVLRLQPARCFHPADPSPIRPTSSRPMSCSPCKAFPWVAARMARILSWPNWAAPFSRRRWPLPRGKDWLNRPSGLPPAEVAINVALPEIRRPHFHHRHRLQGRPSGRARGRVYRQTSRSRSGTNSVRRGSMPDAGPLLRQ
jgi:cobaltochelatase CobN